MAGPVLEGPWILKLSQGAGSSRGPASQPQGLKGLYCGLAMVSPGGFSTLVSQVMLPSVGLVLQLVAFTLEAGPTLLPGLSRKLSDWARPG